RHPRRPQPLRRGSPSSRLRIRSRKRTRMTKWSRTRFASLLLLLLGPLLLETLALLLLVGLLRHFSGHALRLRPGITAERERDPESASPTGPAGDADRAAQGLD